MAAHQAPPSLGFSRQEHWSGLPVPSPRHESEKVKVKSLSRVRLPATPWTEACQAPPSTGFSRQEPWSGVPLPSPMKQVRVFQIPNLLSFQQNNSPSSKICRIYVLPILLIFRPLHRMGEATRARPCCVVDTDPVTQEGCCSAFL